MGIVFASFFRHALTFVGGALVMLGVGEAEAAHFADAAAPVLTGIATWGVGQLWSLAEKKARD